MRFAFSLLLVWTLLPLGACDVFGDSGESSVFVSVNLLNGDSQAIHILTSDEDFDSSNRLNPGDSRIVSIEGTFEDDLATTVNIAETFRAGTNGVVSTTMICGFAGPSPDTPTSPTVFYTQAGTLDCVDW